MRSPRLLFPAAALIVGALLSCTGRSKGRTVPHDDEPDPVVVAPVEPDLPLWDRVRKGTLPNGLTYYILPHSKPENRVNLWLAVNAGSVQEDDDQQGLAHFVEHMAFNGTNHFAEQQIVDYLEKIGMRFGADVNAYTSFDETVYTLQVPTDDAGYIGTGLDILREWAGEISFDDKEVEKERGVVLEEWRLGRGAGRRVYDRHTKTMFHGSRYADRLPIGMPDILRSAPRDALVRYYKDWYRPDLMAVIVVGDIDPDAIEPELIKRFEGLTGPATPRDRPRGTVPEADGTRVSIETDAELPSTSVAISNSFAHRPERTESDYRRGQLDGLYHMMLNERLAAIGDRPDAPFLWAYSTTDDLTREVEGFSRGATVKDDQVEASLQLLFAEVLRVERHGFTATELARAKKQLIRFRRQAAREIDKHDGEELADEITRNFFEGELMPGRAAEAEMAERLIPEVTLEELNTLAKAWGGADNRVIQISGPASLQAPTKDRVLALIAEVDKQTLEPWLDEIGDATLLATAPTPGTIVAESSIDDLEVTEWTLSNGVKVVIRPTDFENDTVMMSAFSLGGTATASDAVWPSARFASEVVSAGGLGEHSSNQVEKLLAGTVANVWSWIGETEEGLDGSASMDDLETLLQLTYLKMTAPRRDEQAFEVWKQGTLDWVDNRLVVPESVFFEDMASVMNKNHPRRQPPEAADVDKVDLDQAMAFYQDRFGDAGDFTFVFVGNVDPAVLRPLVETYVASLPSTGRKELAKDIGLKHPKGVTKKVIERGQEPKSRVQITFYGAEKWSRDAERDLSILSEVLRMRLREILREDMGGVYGVSVSGGISRRPRQEWSLGIHFGCAPEAVDKLVKAALAEISAIQKSGIGDSYLEKIAEARKRSFEVAKKENWSWMGWIASSYRYGDPLADVLDLEPTLARMTSKHVQAAAKKYGSNKQYVYGVLNPEKKATE